MYSIVLFGGNVEQYGSGNFEGNCYGFFKTKLALG